MATLPASNGSASWQNFIDYWREEDAEWQQKRMVLRYADAAGRDADSLTGPEIGRLIYREDLDRLELRSKAGSWIKYDPLPLNLRASVDSNTQVSLIHTAAGATAGLVITPADVQVTTKLTAPSLTADGTGVTIKTGAKTAKLTTDGTSLVSDSPISAPQGILGGALSGSTLNLTGNATVPSLTVSGTSTLAATSISGIITAPAIGHNLAGVTFPVANQVQASAGFVAGAGIHTGDGTAAIVAQKTPGGAVGAASLKVTATDLSAVGTSFHMDAQLRIKSNRSIIWEGSNQTSGPNVWSTTDPGAANFPDGTLWLQP